MGNDFRGGDQSLFGSLLEADPTSDPIARPPRRAVRAPAPRQITKPDHPRVKQRSKLLVDTTTGDRPRATTLKGVPAPLGHTVEVNGAEYDLILKEAARVRSEREDPFTTMTDDLDATLAMEDVVTGPRPVTLAGDDKVPADITFDTKPPGERIDNLFSELFQTAKSSSEDESLEIDDEATFDLEGFDRELARLSEDDHLNPFRAPDQPTPIPEDASFDEAIQSAVDPFVLGPIEVDLEPSDEWTTHPTESHDDLQRQAMETRVSVPSAVDIDRARDLYLKAIEELAAQRKNAALVNARMAMAYDPDNPAYRAFADDLVDMVGHSPTGDGASVSASGSHRVLDPDILMSLESTGEQSTLP